MNSKYANASGTIERMTKMVKKTPVTNPQMVMFKNMNMAITHKTIMNETIFHGSSKNTKYGH